MPRPSQRQRRVPQCAQRTRLINALRGHLAEHGIVAAQGPANVKPLVDAIDGIENSLPPIVRELARLYLEQIDLFSAKIIEIGKRLRREAARSETAARLQTMPGIGPITAMAIEAFAPPPETFERGRGFLGLAWARSASALNGRQTEAGQNLQNGASRHPPAADHRSDCSGAVDVPERPPDRGLP